MPRILLTNDDGIAAPGLHALRSELRRLGEVTTVAPDAERSAMAHAITTLTPLRVAEVRRAGKLIGYATNGTPADCVKLGLGTLCPDVDLVVSGINLGANTATNVIYSGTVSAAIEARLLGVPSIAISLATLTDPIWSYAATFGRQVAAMVLDRGLPPRVLLNVNVPNLPRSAIRGVRITRQGDSRYVGELALRQDPRGRPYYWLAGAYEMTDEDTGTDAWAVANGYVSVTPITYDLTAESALQPIAEWTWRT